MTDSKYDSWQQICDRELKIYFDRLETNAAIKKEHSTAFTPYSMNVLNRSRNFVNALCGMLGHTPKIIDLASSNQPWFAYLCAEANPTAKVIAFDFTPLAIPDLQSKLLYIQDDVRNIENHKEILSDADIVFCRALSPAQQIVDWYDIDFVGLWQSVLSLLSPQGLVYWIQMSGGTGRKDVEYPFFANVSAQYIADFFQKLDVGCKITKYGYFAIRVAPRLDQKWDDYHIGKTDNKKDLYAAGDYRSLTKWYATQLQPFYEKTGYDQQPVIEIKGNAVCAKIARMLLLNNFRYHDVRIVGESETTMLNVNGRIFNLSNLGPSHDDYFLIDGDEDDRFTSEYIERL